MLSFVIESIRNKCLTASSFCHCLGQEEEQQESAEDGESEGAWVSDNIRMFFEYAVFHL
jgi:hypothetical protein